SAYDGISDVAGGAQRGWKSAKDSIHLPDWAQNIFTSKESSGGSTGGGPGGGGNGKSPKESRVGPALGGTAAGMAYDDEDEEGDGQRIARLEKDAINGQMMLLTKKMIEIRSLLQNVGQTGVLPLPSIVVIGSQSSGKSSVLEAIVGHEFLPKGTNMVTRRPIELTLINTPKTQVEYGEFPNLGLGRITDFGQIQRTLTDLNMAVSDAQCVSDDPIKLSIYSPNVPDLSLIDLPGYIQVVGRDQPLELKQKISNLCDKYIQAPNLILAISAADVDLANSAALRASRRVDPRGERTIGVITKMDLVDPERGAAILADSKYPLRLGYVGVVCRAPPSSSSLFARGNSNMIGEIVKNERAYFDSHSDVFGPGSELNTGITKLREKLMKTLEQSMSANLVTTRDMVFQELEEATYEFKVQYNDRPLSAESYLAESLDSFKHSFKEFSEHFGRPQVRELLKRELDQRVMDILAQRYWNRPIDDLAPVVPDPDPLADLPKADPENPYWHRQLDTSTSLLTKLGIGRLATTVVANALQSHVGSLIATSTFANHPYAQQAITESAISILNDRFFSTSDQVENCIKPYKYEIEVEDNEWLKGRENVGRVIKDELKACEGALHSVEAEIGKRKLKDVMGFIEKVRKGEVILEGDATSGGAGGFSSSLLKKEQSTNSHPPTGREGLFLRERADLLKMRLLAVRSKQCANQKNKYYCPEVFLDVVADKLTATAVLFLNVELLSEFYYHFPRELDTRLGRHLTQAEVERFAREDPRIKKHLDVIQRKEMLELVLQKIDGLRQLEGGRGSLGGSKGPVGRKSGPSERQKPSWRLF
ncbi:dynamin-like GTPase mgm1, partial [Ascosphaera atra]